MKKELIFLCGLVIVFLSVYFITYISYNSKALAEGKYLLTFFSIEGVVQEENKNNYLEIYKDNKIVFFGSPIEGEFRFRLNKNKLVLLNEDKPFQQATIGEDVILFDYTQEEKAYQLKYFLT